jgi:hypothetical protein
VVPKEDELPKDHTLVEYTSANIGLLLGKKHVNILKLSRNHPRTRYEVVDESLWIWGPSERVKNLCRAIQTNEQELIDEVGPPVPKGALPAWHTRRRVVVPQIVAGHLIGKNGSNLKKLRGEGESLGIYIYINI